MPSASAGLDALWRRIEARLGVCPEFYKLAGADPATASGLFDIARIAYLESPIPSLLKEQLLAYFSRFLETPYSLARHCAFLLGRGSPSGDPSVSALSADAVLNLLLEPAPHEAELPQTLRQLQETPAPLTDWPRFDSPVGALLRVACLVILLDPKAAAPWVKALRRLLGPQRYTQLEGFLAFVRFSQFWAQIHPELTLEPDAEAMLVEHRALSEAIFGNSNSNGLWRGGERAHAELRELRHSRALLQAMRDSEQRYFDLYEHAPDMYCSVDVETSRVLRCNQTLVDATGFSRAEIVGKPVLDRYAPESLADAQQCLEQFRATGEIHDFELALCRKGGGTIDVSLSITAVRDATGRIVRSRSIWRDISARKAADRALRRSEEQLRGVLESITDGFLALDGQWRFTYLNKTGAELIGLPIDQALGRCVWDLYPDARERRFYTEYRRVAETGVPAHFEEFYPEPLNAWFECHCYPASPGVCVYFRDVTQRHLAQQEKQRLYEEVEEQRRLLNVVFESTPVGLALVQGPQHRYVLANPTQLMIAWGRGTLVGRTVAEVWPEGVGRLPQRLMDRAYQTGEGAHITEMRMELDRGGGLQDAFFNIDYLPIHDNAGTVTGLLLVSTETTEQVRARRVIERSEERLRQLADAMPQLVWTARGDGLTEYYNSRVSEYSGITRGSDGHWSWQSMIHPEDLDRTLSAWQHAVRTRTQYQAEHRIRMSDGAYRWHLSRAVPVSIDAQTWNWFGTATDIHAQKQAEASLRESQGRLRLAQNAAGIGVHDLNTRTGELWWDDRVRAIWGVPLDAPVSLDDFWHGVQPDDAARVRAELDRSLDPHGGGAYFAEFRVRPLDGSAERWVRATGSVSFEMRGETREPVRLIGTAQDVTEQKQTDLKLRETVERFRTLADNIAQLAWMADSSGWLFWYNQRWFDYTGTTPADMEGWGWRAVHHPQHVDAVTEKFRRHLQNGEVWEDTFPLRGKDGEYRWFLSRAIPIRDAEGRLFRWFGTNTDITERKLLEEERQSLLERERLARADAERANRAKDDFLATLGHELRTPLNAILGWAQLVARSPDDLETVAEGLQVIQRNARMQSQLISDLLDLSRINAGTLRLEIEPTDLSLVIEAAVEAVRPTADAKQIALEIVLGTTEVCITADPRRLQQVVWNLLTNAVKFTPDGGRVRVELQMDDALARILVQDNGQGIAPEFLPLLFGRFQQADASSAREHGGLGIGLALVKQLVELHDGKVWAESGGRGKGASFFVELPRQTTARVRESGLTVPLASVSLAHSATAAMLSLERVRVLLVEDAFDAREIASRILLSRGALVETAASADEALLKLRAGRFDVLVSDIAMPRMDGYDLIQRLRSEGNLIPAAALTAFARAEDRIRALRAGFQAHISKPIESIELIATVALLARSGRRDSDSAPKAEIAAIPSSDMPPTV